MKKIDCEWVQEHILLYGTEDLAPQDAKLVRHHLSECADCATAAQNLVDTSELVQSALQTTLEAPPNLETRVMASLRAAPQQLARKTPSRSPFLSRLSSFFNSQRRAPRLAMAAAALLIAVTGYSIGLQRAMPEKVPSDMPMMAARDGHPALQLASLGDLHRMSLANPRPAEVSGSDARQVSQALSSLVKFPVAAVDLAAQGARLMGGLRCTVSGTPSAFLCYDWNGERVSLYQIDGRKVDFPSLTSMNFKGRCFMIGEADGLTYVGWCAGTNHFVMVSGAKSDDLLRLARYASESPHQS